LRHKAETFTVRASFFKEFAERSRLVFHEPEHPVQHIN
jgi:hypothetical protein